MVEDRTRRRVGRASTSTHDTPNYPPFLRRRKRPNNGPLSFESLATAFAISAGCVFLTVLAVLAAYAPSVSSFSVPFHPDETGNATAAMEIKDQQASDPEAGTAGVGGIGPRDGRPASKPDYMWRFPRYGTADFAARCGWTEMTVDSREADCIFFVRPAPSSNEGISQWMTDLVAGYIYAAQFGCRLVFDYGPGVDFNRVLAPADEHGKMNWTVPHEVETSCHGSEGCHKTGAFWQDKSLVSVRKMIESKRGEAGRKLPETLAAVPNYRTVYLSVARGKKLEIKRSLVEIDQYRNVELALPGFEYETGFACALGAMLDLSPTASEFVPNLYTKFLPALRDEKALVISLYIRTGRTDEMVQMEKKGEEIDHKSDATKLVGLNEMIVKCALHLEEDHVSRGSFTRSVWMVTSDSPNVAGTVVSRYDGHNVTMASNSADSVIQREVLTTFARGVQTKPQRVPQTADFAEAMIDYWLLGESDFVVSIGSYSFSGTAALRTARPMYVVTREGCYKRNLPSVENRTGSNFPAYHW